MNDRSLVLVSILGGIFLSALIARNGDVLLLALPFLVYLILGVLQSPMEVRLVATRLVDRAAIDVGEQFETRIVISNQGRSLVNLHLSDVLLPSMTVLEGSLGRRIALGPGQSTELKHVCRASRGVYAWNTIQARASDPFGLVDLVREVPAAGGILVRPAPMPIRSLALKPRATLQAGGPLPARRGGSGTDFWEVREYQAGDPLQRLNWRLAARNPPRLFTNEYEREEIADFGLILDARSLSGDQLLEQALFEYSISAAASLAEYFLKRGNRVALLAFGATATFLLPGYGKRQLHLILRALAGARLGTDRPPGVLEYFPVRLFPSRSQIVMISAVDSRDVETYARLRAYGYEVLLICPDAVDYAARRTPSAGRHDLAFRAARLERALLLGQVLKMGVEVIDWQVSQSLESAIQGRAGRVLGRGRGR